VLPAPDGAVGLRAAAEVAQQGVGVTVASEVRHGPHPRFRTPLGRGRFSVLVVCGYTKRDGWAAGGVRAYQYASRRQAKRRNELLALRSCFLDWWLREWNRQGGTYASAVTQLRGYPIRPARFRRRRGLWALEVRDLGWWIRALWAGWR
jgi:hypothetical protein